MNVDSTGYFPIDLHDGWNLPQKRDSGEPWIAYMELEPHRRKAPSQDLFISFRADDDLQVTYAGASYHPIRNYFLSPLKHAVSTLKPLCILEISRRGDHFLNFLHVSMNSCLRFRIPS